MEIIVSNDDAQFWLSASEASLNAIWDNDDDDVYGQLLREDFVSEDVV